MSAAIVKDFEVNGNIRRNMQDADKAEERDDGGEVIMINPAIWEIPDGTLPEPATT